MRKCAPDLLAPQLGVTHLGKENDCIVIATQFVIPAPRVTLEAIEHRIFFRQQLAVRPEEFDRQLNQFRRTRASGAKTDFPLRAIVQKHFAVGRLKPGLQRGLTASAPCQRCQRELDMLASPERIGGEVRTRTKVSAQIAAANSHTVAVLALRICDTKFGEHRLSTEVLNMKTLFDSELASLDPASREVYLLRLSCAPRSMTWSPLFLILDATSSKRNGVQARDSSVIRRNFWRKGCAVH